MEVDRVHHTFCPSAMGSLHLSFLTSEDRLLSLEYKPDAAPSAAAVVSPRPKVPLNLGDSVMRSLFRRGHYGHILERVFFLLDPPSLRACDAVCTEWRDFLSERVWQRPDGTVRIRANWMEPWDPRGGRRVIGGGSLGPAQLPRDLCADGKEYVVGCFKNLDVLSRKGGDGRRLLTADRPLRWKLALSPRFLLAKQCGHRGERLEVFDRRADYNKLTMSVKYPQGFASASELIMLGEEDAFLMATRATPTDHLPALARFRVDANAQSYSTEWIFRGEFSVFGVSGDRRDALLCGKARRDQRWLLMLLDLTTGRAGATVALPEIETDEGVVKGVAYTNHLGIAVVARTREHREDGGWVTFREEGPCAVFFCDMVLGVVLKTVRADLSAHLGADLTRSQLRLWCDPPEGTLLVAARGGQDNGGGSVCGRVLLWDLRKLLFESMDGETVTPDSVMEAGAAAALDGDSIVVSQHRLVYPGDDGKGEGVLIDLDFWGK